MTRRQLTLFVPHAEAAPIEALRATLDPVQHALIAAHVTLCREDELAASMMGVPLMRTKLAAYAVGAFAGGIGGVAFATYVNGIYASRFDFAISIILLAMVVLGGMGNVWGVTVGALALAWINSTGLEKFGDTFNEAAGTNVNFKNYQFLLFGLILVLMMLFRREGLIPETRTKQVLAEPERGELEAVGADMEGGQS